MRTTVTLDPDVMDRIQAAMRRSGKAMKTVINDALRLGLGIEGKPVEPPPFEVRPHAFGFRPGTDLDRMNQLVDELEADEAARRHGG